MLFIDASKDFQTGRTQNLLLDKHIQKIIDSFKKFNGNAGYCSVENIGQIAKNNFSLEILQYIAVLPAEKKEEQINISDALQ